MRFFKTKKDAVEFSRDFYETYLFGPKIGGLDPVAVYAETVYRTISKDDAMFSAVQLPKLRDELLGLQLEMIGTAWTYKSKEPAAMANSNFTRKYLADMGRSDLWEIMGEYNHRVADSASYAIDPKSRLGRAQRVFLNEMRTGKFDTWHEKGIYDSQAIARVVNRLGTDTAWNKGLTPGMIGIRAMLRLDIEGTDLIGERLAAVAYGFYTGAEEALDWVKLTA